MDIYISGYGVVAKEFVQLIHNKAETIESRYTIKPKIKGIIIREGIVQSEGGLDLPRLLHYGVGTMAVKDYAKDSQYPIQPIDQMSGHVLVEATSTNANDGEPAYSYIKQALTSHMDVVSISKGALVHHYEELMKLSESVNRRIKFSGATAAALPTLDVGEYSLAGMTLTRFEGVLNGTTSYILDDMHEQEVDFSVSLQRAQEAGIAEKDPAMDVSGKDSANKLLLLANRFFSLNNHIQDVDVTGIMAVTKEQIADAKASNHKIVLLASAVLDKQTIHMNVQPTSIPTAHPLANLAPKEKGICFYTEEMGRVAVTGGASSPVGAAGAALKDMINLVQANF
ncbi:homoserine dehydrogenase [Geomicrobium sp. JCM 19038]|uniref:homoserine dehydrogenase n=1 Tax=Geomicrobium sp. JCM 19038 TaxID=1460635 RepID=UPI00045F3DB1|nr:homoserine dehydrogenase [Geomicrobium sp. JCM 19038]GAK08238.1 homoserine dehydrogenase [Geomicrobium sp. JCM 19038]